MSYDVTDVIKVIVVIVGIILVLSGFADLANMSLSEQVIGSVFGLLGTGLIKIIVGGIFVLADVYPDAIDDLVRALTGRWRFFKSKSTQQKLSSDKERRIVMRNKG